MSVVSFIIILIVIVISIFLLIYYFSTKQRVLRALNKIPYTNSSSLKINQFSKVSGKALNIKEPLLAPYSKRKCVFYQIHIERKVKNGKHSHWQTLIKEEQFQDFLIDSNGNYSMVKPSNTPKNYEFYLVKDEEQNSGFLNEGSQRFKDLLESYNIKSTTWVGFNKTLKYTEGIIEVGETITVAGIVKWETLDKGIISNYPYSKIACLDSNPENKLIITDLPEALLNKN